ncbi:MAG: ATPase, T2SS/T4P/T4SS family [Patescibacteria group bacterium]
MALKVTQNPPTKASGRQFVEFLITRGRLKDGFRGVLGNRELWQVDQYLLEKNLATKDQLQQLYADYYGLPFLHLANLQIRPEVLLLIPEEVAKKFTVLPYQLEGRDLTIAIGRPAMLQSSAPQALLQLRQQKGLDIHLTVAPLEEVIQAIERAYRPATPPSVSVPTKPAAPFEIPSTHPVRSLNKQDLINEVDPRQKTVDLTKLKIPQEVLTKIPYQVAKKYQIIIFGSNLQRGQYEPAMIQVGVVNPNDQHVKEILGYIEQKNKILVDTYLISVASLQAALAHYPSPTATNHQPAPVMPSPVKPVSPLAANPAVSGIIPEKPTQPPSEAVAPAPPIPEASEGIVIAETDIASRPSTDLSNDNIAQEAQQRAADSEDQDLDKLISQPITDTNSLANVIRAGAVPEIVAAILFLGIRMKASDVHLEAQRDGVRLRYRVDGILHDIITMPKFMHAPLISRVKILSKMKIDEQRVPQDGRFDVTIDKRQVDLRVSTLPTVFGEKVVMRLLDKTAGLLTLEQMGITEANFDTLVANIDKPYGIILATGPTGSGKTTTLYAILNRISKPGINIITLEDPVEYELPGINQAQVKPQIGFNFADGLRSVLRQDPNVIMVGEVRDLETAAMATHAALTGHLVLSTLHTNDAAGALPRMINMGVEPFLITSSVNAVIGQRLVRRVCPDCREKAVIPPAVKDYVKKQLGQVPSGQLTDLNLEQLIFYQGKGCPNCTNGYRGRIGIFEVLAMNEKIEDLAVSKAPSSDIKKAAVAAGMITMIQDGLIKALKGITTVDEVMRVTTASIKDAPQE